MGCLIFGDNQHLVPLSKVTSVPPKDRVADRVRTQGSFSRSIVYPINNSHPLAAAILIAIICLGY
jgi:hypothetical protein